MTPKLFGSREMSGVFWTLFIEIIFYALCIILHRAKLLNTAKLIGPISLILHLITPSCILINYLFGKVIEIQFILFHLSFLFFGTLLRMWLINADIFAKKSALGFLLLTVFTVPLCAGLFFEVPESFDKGFTMFAPVPVASAYFLAFILFLLYQSKKLNPSKYLKFVGEISYSFYLLHTTVISATLLLIKPNTIFHFLAIVVASISATIIISNFSFLYIEKPGVNFGKRITRAPI